MQNQQSPLTPKIWLLILPSGCYKFPSKLVLRIWSEIKIATSTWQVKVFSLPACWIMYGCLKEKLHVYHFQELKHVQPQSVWLQLTTESFWAVLTFNQARNRGIILKLIKWFLQHNLRIHFFHTQQVQHHVVSEMKSTVQWICLALLVAKKLKSKLHCLYWPV